MNKRKAFTLIELLVVIAIIALLMAILIPALNVVREQARGMNCLANQRSLAMAYIMYANENDSRICGGYVAYDPVNGIPPWVKGPLKYSGPKMVALGEGEVTVEQRINGIKAGELYKYIGETKAYQGTVVIARAPASGSNTPYTGVTACRTTCGRHNRRMRRF